MGNKKTILYIGGFELPDRNAAAQRVIGIAKSLRDIGFDVVFINSLKGITSKQMKIIEYYGFKTYEHSREKAIDYLITGKSVKCIIKELRPDYIIAYNYPSLSLDAIARYCKKNRIKIIADVSEWYKVESGNVVYRIIKNADSEIRMRCIHKKLDGIIAISRFIYDYYNKIVRTVLIPPTVDVSDDKWSVEAKKIYTGTSIVYAGSPSAQKERLDTIVSVIEKLAKTEEIRLNILGINEQEYRKLYNWHDIIPEQVIFWGHVNHSKVIEVIKSCNWSIIIRDNNWVVNAGFPTKLVESITCGTPVIINRFSNVEDYVSLDNGILVSNLSEEMGNIVNLRLKPAISTFDYHKFETKLRTLFYAENI